MPSNSAVVLEEGVVQVEVATAAVATRPAVGERQLAESHQKQNESSDDKEKKIDTLQ